MNSTASTLISKTVSFTVVHGKKIFVVEELVPNSKKMVIFSHGFRGSSLGPARQFVDFSSLLNQQGISTLRFDQPCSGNSEGDFLDSSFSDWVRTTGHLAAQYLQQGYQVALLGQSMGATTSVAASALPQLSGNIAALLLWVPDPKSSVSVQPNEIFEEEGQKYRGVFWNEAREQNFFDCLSTFTGKVHLVYGEEDRYISQDLRERVIAAVRNRSGEVMLLPNEDHSRWRYETARRVMEEEMRILKVAFSVKA